MIKAREEVLRKILMLFDLAIVFVSFLLALRFRQHIHDFYRLDIFPDRHIFGTLSYSSRYLSIFPLVLILWLMALKFSGLYSSFRKKKFSEVVRGILKSMFFVTVIFATVVFIFKIEFISRTVITGSICITGFLLIVERWIIVLSLRFIRKRGYNYRNILVVGTGQRAKNFIELVHSHSEWGVRIAGLIDTEKERLGMVFCGERVIGLLEDIPVIIRQRVIDEVIFIVPRTWLSVIEKSLLECETQGIKATIAADFFNMKIARSAASEIEGIPFLGFETTPAEEWRLLIKRIFDIIFSLAGIIIGLPIFIILIITIKYLSPGNAIFKQTRSGLNGREFTMYKFRTMVDGAEEKRHELSSLNEMGGPVFKMRNDPRVTGFGKFLRKTSLDELPQLFNVLKGDMSLVGPRPPLPSEVAQYEVWQRRRLSMKPGLTCLWQVNGRSNVDFDRWMKMDLEYIDNWSLALDFKILLKTVPAVLFSIGAR